MLAIKDSRRYPRAAESRLLAAINAVIQGMRRALGTEADMGLTRIKGVSSLEIPLYRGKPLGVRTSSSSKRRPAPAAAPRPSSVVRGATMNLTGWGNYPKADCEVVRPEDERSLFG